MKGKGLSIYVFTSQWHKKPFQCYNFLLQDQGYTMKFMPLFLLTVSNS
jgi:hypothetical protein